MPEGLNSGDSPLIWPSIEMAAQTGVPSDRNARYCKQGRRAEPGMTLALVPPIARAVSVCSVNERLAHSVLFRPGSVTAKIRHSGGSLSGIDPTFRPAKAVAEKSHSSK
jgi:hypothetical protein